MNVKIVIPTEAMPSNLVISTEAKRSGQISIFTSHKSGCPIVDAQQRGGIFVRSTNRF
jgi:hypothetical protein